MICGITLGCITSILYESVCSYVFFFNLSCLLFIISDFPSCYILVPSCYNIIYIRKMDLWISRNNDKFENCIISYLLCLKNRKRVINLLYFEFFIHKDMILFFLLQINFLPGKLKKIFLDGNLLVLYFWNNVLSM